MMAERRWCSARCVLTAHSATPHHSVRDHLQTGHCIHRAQLCDGNALWAARGLAHWCGSSEAVSNPDVCCTWPLRFFSQRAGVAGSACQPQRVSRRQIAKRRRGTHPDALCASPCGQLRRRHACCSLRGEHFEQVSGCNAAQPRELPQMASSMKIVFFVPSPDKRSEGVLVYERRQRRAHKRREAV